MQPGRGAHHGSPQRGQLVAVPGVLVGVVEVGERLDEALVGEAPQVLEQLEVDGQARGRGASPPGGPVKSSTGSVSSRRGARRRSRQLLRAARGRLRLRGLPGNQSPGRPPAASTAMSIRWSGGPSARRFGREKSCWSSPGFRPAIAAGGGTAKKRRVAADELAAVRG